MSVRRGSFCIYFDVCKYSTCDRAVQEVSGRLQTEGAKVRNKGSTSEICVKVAIKWGFVRESGPGSAVGITTALRAGRSGNRIPVGGEIFCTCPYQPWGPPSLLYNGCRVFPRGKERPGRDADPSPLLVPWSRKGRAIPLLPLWAVRPVQSLSACTRVHFTFFTFYDKSLHVAITHSSIIHSIIAHNHL